MAGVSALELRGSKLAYWLDLHNVLRSRVFVSPKRVLDKLLDGPIGRAHVAHCSGDLAAAILLGG